MEISKESRRLLEDEWRNAESWARDSDLEFQTFLVDILADEDEQKLVTLVRKNSKYADLIGRLALLALQQAMINNADEDEKNFLIASN